MTEPTTHLQDINGLQTGVCVHGEGQPVVALHGWEGSIQSFWPVAEQLAPQGYQLHLLDLPGFGESALPPKPWSIADYMNFVVTYLDNHDLQQVAVLGHSFGGRIGLVLAAEHPARVRKMVLADSAGLRTPPSLKRRTLNATTRTIRCTLNLVGLRGWQVRLRDFYNRRFASDDYLNAGPLRETFVQIIHEDLAAFAQRVQAPTVLIWGDQDTDTPLWQGRKLEQLIPDAGLIVFQGAGHFAYLERLADYVRIVDHFLSKED
jgi:pimeloyl-ACP methyl ester carboxylesterase